MAPQTKAPGSEEVSTIYLLTELVKVQTNMMTMAEILTGLKETNEGTLRTKGIKEKLAQAELNIDANKASFSKLERNLDQFEKSMQNTLQEAFTEIGKKFDDKVDQIIASAAENKTAISKMQPWFNALTWLIMGAASVLLGMLISGNLQIIRP